MLKRGLNVITRHSADDRGYAAIREKVMAEFKAPLNAETWTVTSQLRPGDVTDRCR